MKLPMSRQEIASRNWIQVEHDKGEKVVFLKEGKRLLAVFPEIPHDFEGNLTCYAHVGQHGGAAVGYCQSLTPTMNGIDSLKTELESMGYKLYVLSELPPIHIYAVTGIKVASPSKRLAEEFLKDYNIKGRIKRWSN